MRCQKTILVLLFLITVTLNAQETQSCLTLGCHDSFTKAENIHPVIEDDCETCHDQNYKGHPNRSGKEFKLNDEIGSLCFECHDTPGENLVHHKAFSGGECTSCHSPHSSDNYSLLKAENVGELCAECHKLDVTNHTVKHGPVAIGQCQVCHDPHQSANQMLLREDPQQLCFGCHTEKQEMLNHSTVHAAYDEGCLDCHNPHGSENEYLVTDKIPNLCLECHDDMGTEFQNAKTVHNIINQEKSCISCHLPHTSQTGSLLVKEGKDLCFTCHDKKYKNEKRTLKNIHKIVTNSKYKHDAVSTGDCLNCHFSHSSSNNYLLNSEFPFGSYAKNIEPYSFNQCFQCHDGSALTQAKTLTATNFRDGDVNMHYLHISQNKGRNCTLCHNVHGSQKPHLIAKTVQFGKWAMPVNYKVIENGGSCAPGCHGTLKYVRSND
ncbi:MAG: cytochrome c3 family protein [Bacteroidota bacterium]